MTIKLIRMWSGEDVIADVIEENEYTITMENPIVAVPSQQPGQIAFAPWSPLLQKDKIEVIFTEKFLPRRGRINCSMQDKDGWRWFGTQFTLN